MDRYGEWRTQTKEMLLPLLSWQSQDKSVRSH